MKFRLSNGVDWAAEFPAENETELQGGCEWAWRQHVAEFGIGEKHLLWLQISLADFWVTSGQYTQDGKHSLPPGDHVVYCNSRKNNWAGLWLASTMSLNHAKQIEGLVTWVAEKDTPEQRRASFRVVKK